MRGLAVPVKELYYLPKEGYVQRAHRTHTEEFYEVTESSFDLSELRDALSGWQQVNNAVSPQQALGAI